MTRSTAPHINTASTPEPQHRRLREGLTVVGANMDFSSVRVLNDVSITFKPGEVHTLMGENGAGKSTLAKILSGVYTATSGDFSLDGAAITLGSPRVALRHGIYLVPQEPALMPHLSVAENVFLGAILTRGRLIKHIDWKTMRKRAAEVLAIVGLDIDPDAAAGLLTIAQQQLLECARALVHRADVIFFDEPTSPLTDTEVARLFVVIRDLRTQGCALGFISHRTDEVLDISDRITVLRDGRVVDSVDRSEANEQRLILAMLGHSLTPAKQIEQSRTEGGPVLSVRNLNSSGWFKDISLDVHPGEVVGLAGLVGSGRTELAETIVGHRKADSGRVTFLDKDITGLSPAKVLHRGLTYLPEDRAKHGIFADLSVQHNITASILDSLHRKFGFLNQRSERTLATEMGDQVQLKPSWLLNPIRSLSGGNQQRALFGRLLLNKPHATILDEPTRGVDAGAKADIQQMIRRLAAEGLAVLVISSELEELVQVCDRVLAIYEGRIVQELTGKQVTRVAIGHHIVGSQATHE